MDKEHRTLGEADDLLSMATERNPLKVTLAYNPTDYTIHPFPLCHLYDHLIRFVAIYDYPLAPNASLCSQSPDRLSGGLPTFF